MSLEEELTRIERSLWANDARVYEATYLPDSVLIFPGVGKMGRDAAVAAIRDENASGRHWAEVDLARVSVHSVAPEVALLSYEASARWNYEEAPSKTLCATIYVKRDGIWRVAFHLQTAV